jgi:hypothetical protein
VMRWCYHGVAVMLWYAMLMLWSAVINVVVGERRERRGQRQTRMED